MTRYHVLVADDLAARDDLVMPEGFRFIEPSGPGSDGYSRWWLAEDDGAPAELEQHHVEPVFTRRDDGRVEITGRHVVDWLGVRVSRPAGAGE